MKEIRILHLFPDLLSLYGEYGNVAVLSKLLTDRGYNVHVDRYEDGELSLEDYDLIYIGSGTEDHLMAANKRLEAFRDRIRESAARGDLWLATGNAMCLFGKTITRKGEKYAAAGVFAYETTIDETKRFMGDVLTTAENPYGAELVGFINTSCVYEGIEKPAAKLVLNAKLGNDKETDGEGFCEGGFWATQLIGPFAVKNPAVTEAILSKMTGVKATLPDDSYLMLAYQAALKELRARAAAK